MARRVRFFATQIEKEKDVIPIRALIDSAPLITVGPRAAHTIDELDVALKEHEARLIQMNNSYQTLSERTRELHEARYVLRETAVFFERVRSKPTRTAIQGSTCRYMQAQEQRTDIRSSFDDSSAPLLQHEEHDTDMAPNVQFDLE